VRTPLVHAIGPHDIGHPFDESRPRAPLQVHHRIPLEWAHLFPGLDPNRVTNLIGVEGFIHEDITVVWNKWAGALGHAPSAQEVMEEAAVVDRMFRGETMLELPVK
jgi:hypothetical protein